MSGSQQRGAPSLSKQQVQAFGLPEDFQTYSASPFGSMNQQDARTGMDDNEFFWLENFLLTGKARLRTIWDKGAALYTATGGKTIVYFNWFNIGSASNCAVFLSDGTAYQVAWPSGTVTTISATAGTFYNSTTGQLPIACQYGELYLLIANNNNSNQYWAWDGSVLYTAGTVGPYQVGDITYSGTSYTTAPVVTFVGGSGSGVTGYATIDNGSVVSVNITNPGSGYAPADSELAMVFSGGGVNSAASLSSVLATVPVSDVFLISGGAGYTTPPTVSFSGGGGTGASATATVVSGVVTQVTLVVGGTGYVTPPNVTISGGGGTGATASSALTPTGVLSIAINSGGSGYPTAPTLTFSGGGGTGLTATTTVSGGVITAVNVTSPGSNYSSPPTVLVETGVNNAAYGTISLMPFGISGTSIESFQSRVWISNPAQSGTVPSGGIFNVGAPDSVTDFSTTDGGLLFTASDRFLRSQFVALHQSNGYLYPLADSSVDVVSNVQTGGTPTATTFNFQNTSAQIGCAWRDTVQDYGQAVLFGNANGMMGLYGGAVQKISKKLDDLFANAVFPKAGSPIPPTGGVVPSAAVCNLYTIPVYLLNMTLVDPTTTTTRTVMVGWNERDFFVASQSSVMTFLNTQEVFSAMTAWGTDGTSLYPLFQTPADITKKIVTKEFASEMPFIAKEALAIYIRATDNSTGQLGIPITVTIDSSGIATQVGEDPQLPSYSVANVIQPNFLAPVGTQPVFGGQTAAVPGTALGATLTSTAPDFTVSDITVAYRRVGAQFG